MLGWLLNLGFAGGSGIPSPFQEFVPFVVLVKKVPVEMVFIKKIPGETVVVKRTVSEDVER